MDNKKLPAVHDILAVRAWLFAGAPTASKQHDAESAVKILIDLIECLPAHLPVYCYGSPEQKAALREEMQNHAVQAQKDRRIACALIEEDFKRLPAFALETLIDRWLNNDGKLFELLKRAQEEAASDKPIP